MKKTLLFISAIVFLFFGLFMFSDVSRAVYFASDSVSLFENGKRVTNSSAIWRASYETYFQICSDGICNIGQQFYPVTIFKTTESDLLLEDQWKEKYYLEHEGCEGYVKYKDEIEKLWFEYSETPEYKKMSEDARNEAISKQISGVGPFVTQKTHDARVQYIRAKGYPFYESGVCKIDNDDYRQYLTNLMTAATTNIVFNPGPSEGGEGCGSPGCIGGRIGDDRSYNLDIANGEYKEISNIKIFKHALSIQNIIILSSLVIIVLVLIFYFIKRKNWRLPKN